MYMPHHLNSQEDHDDSAAIAILSIATDVSPSVHLDEELAPEFCSRRGRIKKLPVRYRHWMIEFDLALLFPLI